MLDADGIRQHLKQPEAWEIHIAEEVSSTNDAVLRLPPASDQASTVLFAESQTAGRGRRGNAWSSGPFGSNLLFSCLVHPNWPPVLWGRLTHVMALVLKRALDNYPPAQPLVKWPNDLYLGDQKVSGILVETEVRGEGHAHAVIGVGINVNVTEDEIPQELRGQATSLRAVTRTWVDREMLASTILDGLAEALASAPETFPSILAELKTSHYLIGKPIRARVGEGTVEGIAVDLGSEGELVIETSEGRRKHLTSVDEVRAISRPRS